MEKNLLIFVSILLLNSAPSYADNESGLPALPTASEIQVEEAGSDSSKSLWQKFKEYFGFGEEKKIVEKQPDAPAAVEKTEDTGQTAQSKSINDRQTVIDNKVNDNSSDIPPGSTDEGPMNVKLPEPESEVDVPDQLKLPVGFGDDVIKDSNANEPIQDVTNLDEITRKNNAADNATAASKILDQAEEKTKDVKEPAEPQTEEMSIPQLPEAYEDKTKEAVKQDGVKEPAEPQTEEVSVPQLPEAYEDKAKETVKEGGVKELAEPKTEEVSVPQLPEAYEDKAKEAVKQGGVKELAEPKTEEVSVPQLPEAYEDKAKEALKEDDIKEPAEPKTEEELVVKNDESTVKLVLPTDKTAGASANSPNITVPEYANAANQPNEDEAAISKYKKEFEAKTSKPAVVPKISESELSLENKSKQVDLKASDLEEFDTKQLKFVNNEAQVLILPNDDIVLGVLVDEAKLEQMDFRSYIDKFWENYNKLKREPRRLEIERFVENYDELFDTNNNLYEEK